MEQTKNNRAWIIFATCICLSAGGIGLFMNCTGIIFTAVIDEFGFRSGDLSVYYTIRFLTQAAVVGMLTKRALSKPKLWLPIMAVCGFLNFALMTTYTKLWQWYISSVLAGIAMCCIFVVIPILINNWFNKFNGLLIGISMSASGGMAALFSPVVSKLIAAHGWRFAALVLGGCGALLMAVPAFLFINMTPEELGLKPYGYTPADENASASKTEERFNVPLYLFPILSVSIIGGVMMSQFSNQIPIFAISINYTLAIGASMSSFCQVGNLLGKTVFGILADKLGIFKTAYLIMAVSSASYILFLFAQGSVPLLCLACCCFGISFSLGTTAPSLLLRAVYGEEYKVKMPQFQSVNNIITAALASVIPYIYDFTGSFTVVFVGALVGLSLAFAGYCYAQKFVRSRT